jgi:hypothetical protein
MTGKINRRQAVSKIKPSKYKIPKRRENTKAEATNHKGQAVAG